MLRNFNSAMVLLDRAEGGGSRGDFGGGGGAEDFGGGSQRPQARPQPATFDNDLDDDVPF